MKKLKLPKNRIEYQEDRVYRVFDYNHMSPDGGWVPIYSLKKTNFYRLLADVWAETPNNSGRRIKGDKVPELIRKILESRTKEGVNKLRITEDLSSFVEAEI